MVLDRRAHALTAFRVLANGEDRAYTATTFPRDPWEGCEHTIRTGMALGYLRQDAAPDHYAVLDVLDESGDIVQDYGIPKADGFRWIKRRLNFAVAPASDDTQTGGNQ